MLNSATFFLISCWNTPIRGVGIRYFFVLSCSLYLTSPNTKKKRWQAYYRTCKIKNLIIIMLLRLCPIAVELSNNCEYSTYRRRYVIIKFIQCQFAKRTLITLFTVPGMSTAVYTHRLANVPMCMCTTIGDSQPTQWQLIYFIFPILIFVLFRGCFFLSFSHDYSCQDRRNIGRSLCSQCKYDNNLACLEIVMATSETMTTTASSKWVSDDYILDI